MWREPSHKQSWNDLEKHRNKHERYRKYKEKNVLRLWAYFIRV